MRAGLFSIFGFQGAQHYRSGSGLEEDRKDRGRWLEVLQRELKDFESIVKIETSNNIKHHCEHQFRSVAFTSFDLNSI